jgi:hypothetical protein
METTYTAQRIADTENGWLITTNETKEETIVFCRLDANTAEDAVAVLEASKAPSNE